MRSVDHPGDVAEIDPEIGLVGAVLGLTQTQLLVGSAHWLVEVLHLLVGIAAIGMAEGLAARTKERLAAVA